MAAAGGAEAGLQPERTTLAWRRTALAVLVNAIVVLRTGSQAGRGVVLLLGLTLLAAAGAVVALGALRARHLAAQAPPRVAPAWLMAGVAALVCLAAVAGATCIALEAS